MAKVRLDLQHSESIIVQAAANIYSAYIAAGKVTDGQEQSWMARSITEAVNIAQMADRAIQSDDEMG